MKFKKALMGLTAAVATVALAACSAPGAPSTGASAPAGGGGGAAAAKTLKLAHNQTETHPTHVALKEMAAALNTETKGALGVEISPNSTLGNQAEYLQMVKTGAIDMAIVSSSQLVGLNPDYAVLSLPGNWTSIDQQMTVLNDPAVTGTLYKSTEKDKVTVVGGITQGARSMYSKKGAIKTAADLAGQKIRVQEDPMFLAMITAMGATPTPMAFSEVYTALQSGVIDGAENNEISYFTQKHYEVAKYFTSTRHLIGVDYLVINTDVLNGMTADQKSAFDKVWKAAYAKHLALWKTETEKAITETKAKGAEYSEIDPSVFKTALTGVAAQFTKTDSAKALYDSITKAAAAVK